MKIKTINYGIGCRIGDTIYINKELKEYPELYKQLIKHEKNHSSGFDLRDIIIDFQGKHLKMVKKEYYKFLLKNPKAWINFMPFWVYGGKLVYDPIMIFLLFLIILWLVILI